MLMYELAWRMSRDNNDLLWWSIIGHTEQLLMLKSEVDKYLIGSGNLRDHVSRLNVNPSVSSDGSGSSENSRHVGKCHIRNSNKIRKTQNEHLITICKNLIGL